MAEPTCIFCHKQLPSKRERVLLLGQSKEAVQCVEAVSTYLQEKHLQSLDQILQGTSRSACYTCSKCSAIFKRWFSARTHLETAEAEVRSTSSLHSWLSEMQQTSGTPEVIHSPQGDLGSPQAASSPIHHPPHTRSPLAGSQPSAKRRKRQAAGIGMQVAPTLYTLKEDIAHNDALNTCRLQ